MSATLEQLREAARIACCSAYAAYSAALRGDVPAGSHKNFDPVVGCPALEWAMFEHRDPLDCIGMLEKIAWEPRFTQEQWNEGGDGPDHPIPKEQVWYLRTFDGRELRWTNACFVRVPDSRKFRAINPIAA